MIRRLFYWFEYLSIWPRLFLSTLFTSIPFYFAAFLSSSVANAYKAETSFKLAIHFAVFSILITSIIFFYRILCFYYDRFRSDIEMEHSALLQAFTLCDRTIIRQHRLIKDSFNEPSKKLRDLIVSVSRIQEIIIDVHSLFESIYGNQDQSCDRIDFEVTFMTKSYTDNRITIPCSASRNGRRPRSMVLREKNNEIYNDTETARLYKATRPDMIIIPDASIPTYTELYPTQKERIKSSIIYPILCEENRLLGTMVIHCDKKKFFSHEKSKFWADLFEVFSKRISVEKMKLDSFNKMTKQAPIQLEFQHESFF